MVFEEAYQKVNDYFEKEYHQRICCALDTPSYWIFYAGKRDEVEIGGAGIKVCKETGLLENFFLPDDENFLLLDQAIPISI